jgi:hypothetical protein
VGAVIDSNGAVYEVVCGGVMAAMVRVCFGSSMLFDDGMFEV